MLQNNEYVICDRYISANFVHQGGKCKSDEERRELHRKLELLEHDISGLPRADITLFLYIPLEISMARSSRRAKSHGMTPDLVEANVTYVRNSFASGSFFAKELGWKVINGIHDPGNEKPIVELSEEEVHLEICKALGME